jgi:hypothetical protein
LTGNELRVFFTTPRDIRSVGHAGGDTSLLIDPVQIVVGQASESKQAFNVGAVIFSPWYAWLLIGCLLAFVYANSISQRGIVH